MKILDFEYIRSLSISPQTICDWCNAAWKIKSECILPAKTKMWQGCSGRYISMPCVIPQLNVAGVKFVSRNVDDYQGIPARSSNIMIQRCSQPGLWGIVDGIWITNMRTGAIAAHSVIKYGKKGLETLGIMGLGIAARSFMYILGNIYHGSLTVRLLRYKNQAEEFIGRFSAEFPWFRFEIVEGREEICSCDAVVSAVGYARSEMMDSSVFQPGCVVIPIHTAGFQGCDLTFDKIVIDDFSHTKDYRYYQEFKTRAIEIEKIETGGMPGRESDDERIIVYSGGIALHDIYIAAKLLEIAETRREADDVCMKLPGTRFWI